jgi:1-acyl-sn-glycerol-3-phosphate acyltransferase
MATLRFLIFNLLSWCTVVPWTFALLLAWPFGSQYSYMVGRNWAQIVGWLAKYICGLSSRVEGIENFPSDSSVVFLKHSSAFETYMLLTLFPRSCWVLKKELLWVPFFGWTLIPLKAIAIDRSKGSTAVKQVIAQGAERLAEGLNVSVFPEGTRMPAGETKRYGKSGTLLAQATGHRIVPIAHNAGYHWPRRGMAIKPGVITFVVGKPVDPAGRDPGEVNAEIQSWVEAEVARIVAADTSD